jgi:hypothetical protein
MRKLALILLEMKGKKKERSTNSYNGLMTENSVFHGHVFP